MKRRFNQKPTKALARELESYREGGRIPKKGEVNRKILIDVRVGAVAWMFHATKGWRRRYDPA